jgi:hypothetical protein
MVSTELEGHTVTVRSDVFVQAWHTEALSDDRTSRLEP